MPYHFLFGARAREFPRVRGLASADLSKVKPETKEGVFHLIEQKLRRPMTEKEKHGETPLDALGLDSLDRMEVTLAVEHQFGFSGDQVPLTVGQLWALAQGLVEREPPRPPDPAWFRPLSDDGLLQVMGETIPEAFVNRALACRRDVAAADDLAGVVTYERMLVGALVMAKRFAELPGANVGLMLPASVACDIAFLALHLAEKLPVLLNWTAGPANLARRPAHGPDARHRRERSSDRGCSVEGSSTCSWRKHGKIRPGGTAAEPCASAGFLVASASSYQRFHRSGPRSFFSQAVRARRRRCHSRTPTSSRRCIRHRLPPASREVILGFLPAFHSLRHRGYQLAAAAHRRHASCIT